MNSGTEFIDSFISLLSNPSCSMRFSLLSKNTRPLEITWERWYDPNLNFVIALKTSVNRSWYIFYEVQNIDTGTFCRPKTELWIGSLIT